MFSTTKETSSSFTWIITGEKGSLKLEGGYVNIQMEPPILYMQQSGEEAKKLDVFGLSATELYREMGKPREDRWKVVEVDQPLSYGQVGEVYEAFVDGEKEKGSLVDFEGAALKHRTLEACFKSSRDRTRETYRK